MNKNTYILGGIFLVLVLFALLVLQKPGEQSSSNTDKTVFKIDSSAIDKIELQTPASFVTLEKRGTEWFITQPILYKANQDNVGQMLGQAKAMESKGIITSKSEKFAAFEVNNTGTQITLSAEGAEQAKFILGKMGSTYMETYMRAPSSNDVLLVTGVYGFTFNRPLKEWRDKTILKTAQDAIGEITYHYGDTTFALSLNNNEWFLGNTKAKKSAVESIVGQLSNLRCTDFIDSVNIPAPKTVAIISYAGVQVQFAFDKLSGKYIVQASNSTQRYVMDSWQANQVLKRKKELFDTAKK